MPHKSFVWLCLLPLAVVTAAFFLLPMARLVVVGAGGPQGLAGYLAILIEPRYRATLINTVALSVATTIVTLIVATIAGMFLQRHRFPGRTALIANHNAGSLSAVDLERAEVLRTVPAGVGVEVLSFY